MTEWPECTKFHVGWGSALDLLGSSRRFPQTPVLTGQTERRNELGDRAVHSPPQLFVPN